MQPFRAGFSPWGEAFRWLYSDDINAATLVIPRNLPSGESFTYHDATTQAIGMLLTSVFDKRYGDYLADLVWEPLGARRAWVWLDSEDGTAHHNCCLLATARDWAKLGLLFANRGEIAGRRIVSADWIDLQTSESLIPHYGFQTWLATNDSVYPLKGTGLRQEQDWLDEDAFFFSGYGGQRVYVSPNHRLVVVRLGPAAGYFPKFANEWDNAFLLNTAIRGLQPANVPPARMP
jgi:CubicO group peptidase (beta-lactamase class C family)